MGDTEGMGFDVYESVYASAAPIPKLGYMD